MKKTFLTLLISLFTLGIAVAQDVETATNIYNAGATALSAGNNREAITQFESALTSATALGEEGASIANDCKEIIPKIYMAIGKEYAEAGDFDNAVSSFKKASEKATEYANNDDVVAEAYSLTPKMLMAKAGNLLNDKNYDGAAEAYSKVVEADPENGAAYLRMGMAYSASGNTDAAIEALKTATEKGQADAANKQLSNVYLKQAVTCQKAKDFKGTLEAAQLSVQAHDNANAQKIIGISALQLKQNQIAADGFEAYLAQSPNASDKAQIIYQLGTALKDANQKAKACSYFKQIENDPKWGEGAKYWITTLKCN